jgi:hypothetical protein
VFRASGTREYFLSISGNHLTGFRDWLSDPASLYIAHFPAPIFVIGEFVLFGELISLLENSSKPCDTGSAISELEKQFPVFDFSSVDSVYPDKTSSAGRRYAHTRGAVLARAQSCLHDLYHRPERMVIIVSHSAFLRLAVSGTCFANADYRVFEVSKPNGPRDTYKLVEWERTKECGGGMGRSSREPVEIGSGDLPPDPPQDSQETLASSPEHQKTETGKAESNNYCNGS